MKNKEVRGILALALVTALSFGVILGSKALSKDMTDSSDSHTAAIVEEYDVNSLENIDKAVKTEDGYEVTVREKGYNGDLVMNVSFDNTGSTITKVAVLEHSETENLGARISEADFLSQFTGVQAPVYLPGMASSNSSQETETNPLEGAVLSDGTYESKTSEPDSNGFIDQVQITVSNGKITEVIWDAVTKDGSKKSVMSENGEYVMTEDGLTWKAQAEALADALIENQSLNFLSTDEQGKTDAVSGVSISVGGFISLAEQCLMQAAGIEEELPAETESAAPAEGTSVDGVSGATISSTAAVTGINAAYEFLQTVK
jgi:major membrane immunogen (membrane-anchored lipoprotein)